MPTYELTCKACGHRFERFLPRLLRAEDMVCPECGSQDVAKGFGGGILGLGTKSSPSSTAPLGSCGSGGFG